MFKIDKSDAGEDVEITKEMCEDYCNSVEDMEFESCSMKGNDVSITCAKGEAKKRVRLTKVEILNIL